MQHAGASAGQSIELGTHLPRFRRHKNKALAGLARLLTTQHPLLDMLDDVASSYQAPVKPAGLSLQKIRGLAKRSGVKDGIWIKHDVNLDP